MILNAFTLFHVALSLIGIGSGLVVLNGLLSSKWLKRPTSIFLATTIVTSVTGFLFPVQQFLPSHAVGILSLIVLGIAVFASRRLLSTGALRKTYVLTSVTALYLNVFVLIVQLYLKVPALNALAPTQTEPPFQITQLAALMVFAILAIRATMKFRFAPQVKARAAGSGT